MLFDFVYVSGGRGVLMGVGRPCLPFHDEIVTPSLRVLAKFLFSFDTHRSQKIRFVIVDNDTLPPESRPFWQR